MHLTTLVLAGALVVSSSTAPAAQIDCLTRAIHHEAGGESAKGQLAVAYVILNRVKSKQYPKSVCSVVKQRGQFSNISMRARIEPSVYEKLKTVALTAVSNYSVIRDPTKGALFFMHKRIKMSNLYKQTAKIGDHRFYRYVKKDRNT